MVVVVVAVVVLLSGCVVTPRVPEGRPTPSGPAVATFTVAGGERFKIELATPALVEHAEQLLAGESVSAIPLGTVIRDDPGVNAPWSWHLDPTTVEFAFVTIEVCDGLPSDVEKAVITSAQYCPWSAKIIAIDRLGSSAPPGPEPSDPSESAGGLPELTEPVCRSDGASYTGIAQVQVGDSCTGTLVDTGVPTGPAYVVTNGHCADGRDAGANAVVLGEQRTGDAAFGMFVHDPDGMVSVPILGVPYSTMKGADISVVQLGLTLEAASVTAVCDRSRSAPRPPRRATG